VLAGRNYLEFLGISSVPINTEPRYEKDGEGEYTGQFFHFDHVTAKNFECLSTQGSASTLAPFLKDLPYKSIMLDRAENVLHDWFGDVNYWGARRSMRFAKHLVKIAEDFRKDILSSNDVDDNTVVDKDWRKHKAERTVRGGPYACVHLRRKDYVRARKGQIPSIAGAADQLLKKLEKKEVFHRFLRVNLHIPYPGRARDHGVPPEGYLRHAVSRR